MLIRKLYYNINFPAIKELKRRARIKTKYTIYMKLLAISSI